jgi:hypothetical protein
MLEDKLGLDASGLGALIALRGASTNIPGAVRGSGCKLTICIEAILRLLKMPIVGEREGVPTRRGDGKRKVDGIGKPL